MEVLFVATNLLPLVHSIQRLRERLGEELAVKKDTYWRSVDIFFDDIESKLTIKDADKKAFEWNCCRCVDALVETLDKIILATDLPINDPVRCNNLSIVGNQPGSSSAGNFNPISDGSTESAASGHSNKDMEQFRNDRSQSPPKHHGGSKAAQEIYELDWEIGSRFLEYGYPSRGIRCRYLEDRIPTHRVRAKFSSIEQKQNHFWLDHLDDTGLAKNSDLGKFNPPLHTTALETDWNDLSCPACRIRNGIGSMRETTSMKTAAITLWTAWVSRLILDMQVPVSNCRFQSNSVYTPPITSNRASTIMCI